MAVDHGLGGKDNQKSRDKRARRAKKQKAFALKQITGGKKREVVFDENARVEWLTGFRKRKEERRKFGLTKQVEKEKSKMKEARKDRRNAGAAVVAAASVTPNRKGAKDKKFENKQQGNAKPASDSENDEDHASDNSDAEEQKATTAVFDDNYTTSMFGSGVTISVVEGLQLDE